MSRPEGGDARARGSTRTLAHSHPRSLTPPHPTHTRSVAFAVSGYNGAFSGLNKTAITNRRNNQYKRSDGADYVWPQNIVPARVYLGKKGYDENGDACDDYLCRNGLRWGQMYGFAANATSTAWRDTWHKENYKGATVEGG